MPQIFDTSTHWTNRIGKKTKGLKAKPLITLIVDKAVTSKFMLDTLEAKEVLTPDACICIGEVGEAWQQAASKLIKDYDLASIDTDGWMVMTPKATKMVEFLSMTEELYARIAGSLIKPLYIIGKYGQTIDGVDNCQLVKVGDTIARQRDEHADQWVVAQSIWNRTYTEVAA